MGRQAALAAMVEPAAVPAAMAEMAEQVVVKAAPAESAARVVAVKAAWDVTVVALQDVMVAAPLL